MGKKYPTLGRLPPARPRDHGEELRGMDLAGWRAGHTLVELAVAISILGIFAGVGWSSMQGEVDRFRMMQATRLLHSDLQSLRALAISSNRETRVFFLGADTALDPSDVQVGEWLLQAGNRSTGSNEWDTLPIDLNGEGNNSMGERSLDPDGANEAPHISLAPWPALDGPGTGNADAIVFSPRGWVTNPVSDFTNGFVALRIVDKRALGRGETVEATVRLSRGGLARIEVGPRSRLPATAVGTGEASAP